jgi:hypothetical protein
MKNDQVYGPIKFKTDKHSFSVEFSHVVSKMNGEIKGVYGYRQFTVCYLKVDNSWTFDGSSIHNPSDLYSFLKGARESLADAINHACEYFQVDGLLTKEDRKKFWDAFHAAVNEYDKQEAMRMYNLVPAPEPESVPMPERTVDAYAKKNTLESPPNTIAEDPLEKELRDAFRQLGVEVYFF